LKELCPSVARFGNAGNNLSRLGIAALDQWRNIPISLIDQEKRRTDGASLSPETYPDAEKP